MDLHILFDKDSESSIFRAGWGVAFFLDGVLFDTGEDGPNLISNLEKKGITLSSIAAVVLSHRHWDHIGGLWHLLNIKKGLKVYGFSGFPGQFKDKVTGLGGKFIETEGFTRVKGEVYTTGPVEGLYKSEKIQEQALIARLKEGLVIAVGCAHPGIIKMVEKVKGLFPSENIYLLIGGFHLMDKEKREIRLVAQTLRNLGVKNIGPAHCTGYEAGQILKEVFKERCIEVRAGKTITTF